ncbi:MAG: phosphonate C-P lyase system protein PhnL, partial [Phototrophicaceae bacterium]
VTAFTALDFTLDDGQLLLVKGQNGVGKSTLLRCLYRTYLPTDGQAIYQSDMGEIDLAHAADVDIVVLRRQEIGFVTQFLRPRPRVTALELVAEPLMEMGTPAEEAMPQAEALLRRFRLKPSLWQAYPTTFSGGEQQKVNLSRALIAPRKLLLLDEPTASLDAETRESLTEQLRELKALGVAMIGVFHHPEDVETLIDDTVQLHTTQELDHVVE